ncbi:peroxidase-like [Leptidea sinapis]|uniref:peroxidase-like n=1 Tax=Leptidea sinapis TaxID=189913 RepID=UPI0021C34FF8|nr:peroxidase-like [Leptidea sinapis]
MPEQINYQTPLLDLSVIYGAEEKSKDPVRSYKNGMLRLKLRDNRYVPISGNDCFRHDGDQNLCYKIGLPTIDIMDIRTTTLAIFFMREHNRLAKALHELNPCWKDDRLFKVARQINIATAANIFMYELLPNIMGYSNMMSYGLLSNNVDYVKQYDEESQPGVYAEFAIGLRFFRTFLSGNIKLYNEKYEEVGQIVLEESFNLQNLLETGKILDEINRDREKSKVKLQEVFDQISMDIQRGRDMGVRGYNDYRNLCGLRHAKSFSDLLDVIDREKVEGLKQLYTNVDDIDLLAGIMSETNIDHTFVGPTLFCIIVKQLQLFRYSDRFWFESGDNSHKFSLDQLREIRKTNMARFACDNVDGITFIQPHALLNTQLWNTPVPCANIHGLDISPWRDSSCKKNKQTKKQKQKRNGNGNKQQND